MLVASEANFKTTKDSRKTRVSMAATLIWEGTFGQRGRGIQVSGTGDDHICLGLGQSIFRESGGGHKCR